jgi:hypothetical protein
MLGFGGRTNAGRLIRRRRSYRARPYVRRIAGRSYRGRIARMRTQRVLGRYARLAQLLHARARVSPYKTRSRMRL